MRAPVEALTYACLHNAPRTAPHRTGERLSCSVSLNHDLTNVEINYVNIWLSSWLRSAPCLDSVTFVTFVKPPTLFLTLVNDQPPKGEYRDMIELIIVV